MARRVGAAGCLLLLASVATAAHAANWTYETLDPTSTSGNSMTLRLNPDGLRRYTWWSSSVGIVVSGDGWTTETLPPFYTLQDPAGSAAIAPDEPQVTNLLVQYCPRLALGPDDTPWVATLRRDCFTNCTGIVHIHRRSGTGWIMEDLGVGDSPPAIETGADGRVHVSYRAPSGALYYWVRATNGAWTGEPVGAATYMALPSLRLDSAGEPHLAWLDAGQLWYAVREYGVWQPQLVDSGGIVSACMVLTPSEEPRIAFVSNGPGVPKGLWYAAPGAGGWVRTPVVPGLTCSGLDLALDPAGDPFIVFNDQAGLDLRFASRKHGAWTLDNIDTDGNTGYWPSLAFDALGRPLVAYQAVVTTGARLAIGSTIVGVGETRPSAAFAIRALGGIARAGGPLSLEMTSPAAQRVTLQLVDVAGRVVSRMDDRDVPAGVSTLRWDAAPPAPGIYFVRASASGGATASARLPVIR